MPKVITFHIAIEKARKYCVYQERSQQEVRNKLFSIGLENHEVEQGIVVLIEEGFINEERFAIAYARGRFRMKNWGKVKIKAGLKAKMISDWCIKRALIQIDDQEYFNAMRKVLAARARKVKETNLLKRNFMLAKYVISQGFEPEFVWDIINEKS